jgi:hypothetical protein
MVYVSMIRSPESRYRKLCAQSQHEDGFKADGRLLTLSPNPPACLPLYTLSWRTVAWRNCILPVNTSIVVKLLTFLPIDI